MMVRGKRLIIPEIAATVLLILLVFLMTNNIAYADEEIDLIEHSSIPVIVLHIDETQGATIDDMHADANHDTECRGTMDIIVPDGFKGYVDMDTVPQTIKGIPLDYIRGRGNSTWKLPKKPYKIKLAKPAENEEPVNLFGMGQGRHWVLLANAMDPTIIKNRITFRLGEELGFAFTPQCVPVDVIMKSNTNSEHDVYLGSYYLAEQVRVDPDRLDIGELKKKDEEPDKITGGYLIKGGQQTNKESPNYFTTDRGIILANDTPSFDPDDGYENDAQKSYIRSHIQDLEDAVFGEDFRNQDGVRYTDLMDMKSAADYWLIQQVTSNGDAFVTGSTYFYKVSDTFDSDGNKTATGKFYWGPIWDFDIAYGEGTDNTTGIDYYFRWMTAMLYDKDENGFYEMVKREWPEIKRTLLTMVEEGGIIDQYRNELAISRSQDYERWKEAMPYYYADRYSDYEKNIEGLKKWIETRVEWMDRYIGSEEFDEAVCKVTYMVDGEIARLEYLPRYRFIDMYVPNRSEDAYKPEKEGYIFLGWENESGTLVTEQEQALGDKVYTARYVKEEDATLADEIVFRMDEECCNISEGYVISRYMILPQDAQDKSVIWSSSDPDIAVVDKTGNVTLLAPGTVTITATLKSGKKGSYELTIVSGEHPRMESIEMLPEEMVLEVGEYAKLNVAVQPKLARIGFMGFFSDDEDIASVDYSTGLVTGLKPGTTSILMDASGDYQSDSFVVDKYCKITVVEKRSPDDEKGSSVDGKESSVVGEKISIAKAEVTGLKTKTWTGRTLEQSPVVKVSGQTLKSGTDYTITYKNNKNVGKAALIITGKGKYTGQITKTFKICPKSTSIVKLTKTRKAVKVKWKKQSKKMSESRITGYQVLLATNEKFTKNKKTVTVKGYAKVSKKIKGLKAKKKYYIKMRTYKMIGGEKYYSPWSKIRTCNTR